jgi:UDP-N-acetylglucosamine 2-epimerase (non-hydrolysing)
MLDQVIDVFGIEVNYDLNIMKPNQNLYDITTDVLENMQDVLRDAAPDIVLVHGDTTTSFAAALAAFYKQIPVGHVEAGLRTFNKYSPYPEEMNRCLTDKISELLFAPTKHNRESLLREGICKNVFVTGNTVIDAFGTTVRTNYEYNLDILKNVVRRSEADGKRLLLMTAHRRENLGAPLQNICNAAKRLIDDNDDVLLVYPVHLNPAVKTTAHSILGGNERIYLTDPIDVMDMHNLMTKSYMILTDSGGMQEEAPSFGVPVLVLRTETERPEAVEAGTVKVVGVAEKDIYDEATKLLFDKTEYLAMQNAENPYGDGHASERIVERLLDWHSQCIM